MGKRVYIGQWGLSREGFFQARPWFLAEGKQILDQGFGTPPEGGEKADLGEGAAFPGLVNSHCHLEFSWLGPKLAAEGSFGGIFDFVRRLYSEERPGVEFLLEAAQVELDRAIREGSFYFADICNDPEFSAGIPHLKGFSGTPFFEVLGFGSQLDRGRYERGLGVVNEAGGELAPHSIYGCSPRIIEEIAKGAAKSGAILPIHLLEEAGERELFFERGPCADFLRQVGQYERYPEFGGSASGGPAEYLIKRGFQNQKALFTHFNEGTRNEAVRLQEENPQAAWVLCPRSNEFLGYRRKDWSIFSEGEVPFLLGSDSSAMAGDLSILGEAANLKLLDVMAESLIWRAATSRAYEFFNIAPKEIPIFYARGAKPELGSIWRGAQRREVFRIGAPRKSG